MLSRLRRAARDAWLVLGVSLLLLLALEFSIRGLGALVPEARSETARDTLHPYYGQAWFREFQRESALKKNRFDPYRGHWSMPFAGRWKNTDAYGRRVTTQAPFDSARVRRVLMLGGSTMFGFNVPDSSTIASLLARSLARRGIRDIEVVNLAQGAFNFTQELVTLQLELAHGRTPAVAVFFHGQNDIQSLLAFGEPGRVFSEPRTQALIDLGQRGFAREFVGLGRHSRLVQSILGARHREPRTGTGNFDDPARCGSLAAYYRNLSRSVFALGRDRGFDAVLIQQPMLATTRKPLSAWERTIQPQAMLFRPCAASIDSVMQPESGDRYFSLASIFDNDTITRYTDRYAHLTIDAHEQIAEHIADLVAPILTGASLPAARRG